MSETHSNLLYHRGFMNANDSFTPNVDSLQKMKEKFTGNKRTSKPDFWIHPLPGPRGGRSIVAPGAAKARCITREKCGLGHLQETNTCSGCLDHTCRTAGVQTLPAVWGSLRTGGGQRGARREAGLGSSRSSQDLSQPDEETGRSSAALGTQRLQIGRASRVATWNLDLNISWL